MRGQCAQRRCERRRQPSLLTDLQYRLADRLVLSKVRALFGPKLQLAMVGAAPVAPELLEFFDACGVLVLEGYGLSETCAAATLNTPDAFRFGTVGRPLPGTEVAIAPDGEVLIRGPHVFWGYYNDPGRDRGGAHAPTGGCAQATSGAIEPDGFVHDHRPQEGPDHHLKRQEHHARSTSRVELRDDAWHHRGGRFRR